MYNNDIDAEYIMNKIQTITNNEQLKLQEFRNRIYKGCILKINNSIDCGITDIFYSAPSKNKEYPKYDPLEFLIYIQNKLRKKKFETFIIEKDKMIFISWNHVVNKI
jgi:hypothetical protein